jgi:cation diffusion facilitator CzcD-associated flavoprotein CzcO
VFPSQAEILEYFNSVAAKFDVSPHIVCNIEWEGACWQELTSTWLIKLRDISTGEAFYQECKILISAVGGLVNPNQFKVPGIEDFQGDIVHTACWRPELSLHQKDVIVVGNGCELQKALSTEMTLI